MKGLIIMFLLMGLGVMSYLFITGAFLSEPIPFLSGLTDSTKYNLFEYTTNAYYETSEISYNMEDKLNATYLYDFALNDNHGKILNGTEGTEGIYGDCFSSDTTDIEVIEETINVNNEDFTIEMWLYPYSNNVFFFTQNYTYPIMRTLTNMSVQYQYTGGGANILISNVSLNLNKWNYVAFTYNYSAPFTLKWYINDTITTVQESGTRSLGTNAHNDFSIINIGAYTFSNWDGRIDEVRIYDHECRTKEEIELDMVTPIGTLLNINGINGDVVQLWYNSTNMFQQNTISGTITEFNVYSFSNGSEPYEGVIRTFRDEMAYTSPVIQFMYGDYYSYSVPLRYTLNDMGIFVALIFMFGLPMIIIPTVIIIRRSGT